MATGNYDAIERYKAGGDKYAQLTTGPILPTVLEERYACQLLKSWQNEMQYRIEFETVDLQNNLQLGLARPDNPDWLPGYFAFEPCIRAHYVDYRARIPGETYVGGKVQAEITKNSKVKRVMERTTNTEIWNKIWP